MSGSREAQFRVATHGTERELGAFVVGARFSRDGRTVAFALGDGTVRIAGDVTGGVAAARGIEDRFGRSVALVKIARILR
mgnify:CR=1 FL=1